MHRGVRIAIAACLCVAFIVLSYFLPSYVTPFGAACFCLAAGLIAGAPKNGAAQFLLINLAAVIAAVGLFEVYLTVKPTPPGPYREGEYTKNYFQPDAELGYAIAPGPKHVESVLKSPDGSTVYDVNYGIDRFGLRNLAESSSPGEGKAVFFVGDSFTFGEGVEDGDTLPQQFSTLSGLRSVNFGIHGYGAHQVLRELELDRLHLVDPHDPLAIVYTLLPTEHGIRAAGRAEWDHTGPRYEIVDGALKYVGHFAGADQSPWRRLLNSSSIYTRFIEPKFRNTSTTKDRERLWAILLKIRDLSQQKYHAPLVIVDWDVHGLGGADAVELNQKLRDANILTLSLAASIPELKSDKYYLPVDRHPNAEAYAMVAAKLKTLLESNHNISNVSALP